MQRSTLVLLSAIAVGALLAPAPARAAIGTIDQVPAATLLTPYFEVDLGNVNGPQTRLSVFNVSENPELVHVQLWTDWGTPTFGFDAYLGGRDSLEIDLHLLFNGVIPKSGPGISGNGTFSDADAAFAGCAGGASDVFGVSLPIPDLLSADQIAFLRNNHTGQSVPELSGRCTASNQGDGIARGYVTIDTVNNCSLSRPSDPGYFVSGGVGVASNRNSLVGTFTMVERANAQYPSSPMAHVEASSTDPLTTAPGNHTFYGTLVGALASDNREPLGSIWDARVFSSPALGTPTSTEFVVWRDRGNTTQMTLGSVCGTLPPPFPLFQTEIASLDEAEEVDTLNTPPPFPNPVPPPIVPFPFVAQKSQAAEFFFWESGFVRMNLNTFVVASPYGDDRQQSMVLVRHTYNGVAGAFVPATYLAGPQDPNTIHFSF